MDKRVFGDVSSGTGPGTKPFYEKDEKGLEMRPFVPILAALLLVGTAGAGALKYQPSGYFLSSPGEVEIPARNLTVDGEEYTVRAFGRVDPGDTVRVDVEAPENAEYSVYLYDREFRIERTDSMDGPGRATFSTDGLSPGSYLAAVYEGGVVDVYPVVVRGYDVAVEAPESADGEFTATVTVADGALARDPPQVQVVLGDDDRSVRVDADRVSDGEYRATLPTDRFEPGTYALYGVVRGENETAGGDRVILGVSDRHEVGLEAAPTATPAPGGDGGGGGGGGTAAENGTVELREATLLNGTAAVGEEVLVEVALSNVDPVRGRIDLRLSADGDVLTERTVAVAASTDRTVLLRTTFETPGRYPLAVGDRSLGAVEVAAPTDTAPPTPATRSPTAGATATPTAEDVVTPRPTTAPPQPTTTAGDGPGFGATGAALAVALLALALRRR